MQLTRWIVLGLSDKWCVVGFGPRSTSVCVAWVFIRFLFSFSIIITSCCWVWCWCCWICCCCIRNCCGCWIDADWTNGWWLSIIVGFLPPINLSWLLAFAMRLIGRIPIASSKDVSVKERAKLTCFVLESKKGKKIIIFAKPSSW